MGETAVFDSETIWSLLSFPWNMANPCGNHKRDIDPGVDFLVVYTASKCEIFVGVPNPGTCFIR